MFPDGFPVCPCWRTFFRTGLQNKAEPAVTTRYATAVNMSQNASNTKDLERPDLAERPALPRFEPYREAMAVADVEKMDLPLGAEQLFLLKNVLSPLECRHYIKVIEELGLSAAHWRQGDEACSRLVAESAGLADLLWDRCSHFMADIVIGEETGDNHAAQHLATNGVWKATGVNDRFRASLYTEGAQVGPHNHSNCARWVGVLRVPRGVWA